MPATSDPRDPRAPQQRPQDIPSEGIVRELLGLSQRAKAMRDQRRQQQKQYKHLTYQEAKSYQQQKRQLLSQLRKREAKMKQALKQGYAGSAKEFYRQADITGAKAEQHPEHARRKMMRNFESTKRQSLSSLRRQHEERKRELRQQVFSNDPGATAA